MLARNNQRPGRSRLATRADERPTDARALRKKAHMAQGVALISGAPAPTSASHSAAGVVLVGGARRLEERSDGREIHVLVLEVKFGRRVALIPPLDAVAEEAAEHHAVTELRRRLPRERDAGRARPARVQREVLRRHRRLCTFTEKYSVR